MGFQVAFVGRLNLRDFMSTSLVYMYRMHLVCGFVIFAASKLPRISLL